MPARAKGPRLYLRKRKGREAVWVIRDGQSETSTGCGPGDDRKAEEALADYIARKHNPVSRETKLARLAVADLVNVFLQEHAAHTKSLKWRLHMATNIVRWWGDKTLADIRGATCREYAAWRMGEGVGRQTVRHELATLRAAIGHYHREYGPLDAVPVITMPAAVAPKDRWLTRSEAARLLWAIKQQGLVKGKGRRPHVGEHLKRYVLIGLYSGTRSEAIRSLRWLPSLDAGYIDLERGVLHRRGAGEVETNKRRPPAKIHRRLLPFLRRWQAHDLAVGFAHVCHYNGQRVGKLRRSWGTACRLAGIEDATPHSLRHTCVTWLLQAGVPTWEVAGYVGMSEDMVRKVYGHHAPDFMERAARS